MMKDQETIEDIIAEKRRRADEAKKSLGDQHSYVESLMLDAERLEEAWKRDKAEIEASALDAGGIVAVAGYRRAILDFCNVYCIVYPPGDPDVPAVLQGAFQNFCDKLGIEQVKLGESEASHD